jgi:hypothetical protein
LQGVENITGKPEGAVEDRAVDVAQEHPVAFHFEAAVVKRGRFTEDG